MCSYYGEVLPIVEIKFSKKMMILWIILVFWQNSLLLWLVFFYFEFLNPCKAEGFVISLVSVARLISFFCFFAWVQVDITNEKWRSQIFLTNLISPIFCGRVLTGVKTIFWFVINICIESSARAPMLHKFPTETLWRSKVCSHVQKQSFGGVLQIRR